MDAKLVKEIGIEVSNDYNVLFKIKQVRKLMKRKEAGEEVERNNSEK